MPVDPWAELDDTVLAAFTTTSGPLSPSDVLRRLPDLTSREVRTALRVNVERGYLTEAGGVRTLYTITAEGRRHLKCSRKPLAAKAG